KIHYLSRVLRELLQIRASHAILKIGIDTTAARDSGNITNRYTQIFFVFREQLPGLLHYLGLLLFSFRDIQKTHIDGAQIDGSLPVSADTRKQMCHRWKLSYILLYFRHQLGSCRKRITLRSTDVDLEIARVVLRDEILA